MSISLNMHYCKSIRVTHNHPNNGNGVGLLIQGDGGALELSLFDLPRDVTQRLLLAFGDEQTRVDESVSPDAAMEDEAAA